MGFRPLHDWALIRREEPADRTSGGIIIPDSAKDKPAEGVVLAIGPGKFVKEKGKKEKKFVATVLKQGERVMFIEYMAKDIEIGAETITLIREEDILGTVEGAREVMVKPAYQLEAKQERPPMVQQAPAVASAAVSGKKAQAKAAPRSKAETKKKSPAKKPAVKIAAGAGRKKTAPKAGKKAAKAAKVVKKATKKTAKSSAGKAAKKKAAPRSAARAQKPKKAGPAKAASRKTAARKAVKKTGKAPNKKTPARKAAKAAGRKK